MCSDTEYRSRVHLCVRSKAGIGLQTEDAHKETGKDGLNGKDVQRHCGEQERRARRPTHSAASRAPRNSSTAGIHERKAQVHAHPSRQGFKCWGRERPSGCRVMGTSAMRNDFNVALISISEANSMPVVLSSSSRQAALAKPRSPQWKSRAGHLSKSRQDRGCQHSGSQGIARNAPWSLNYPLPLLHLNPPSERKWPKRL